MSSGADIGLGIGVVFVSLDLKGQDRKLPAVSQMNGVGKSSFHNY